MTNALCGICRAPCADPTAYIDQLCQDQLIKDLARLADLGDTLSQAPRPTSASSSPKKRRSGARSSVRPTSSSEMLRPAAVPVTWQPGLVHHIQSILGPTSATTAIMDKRRQDRDH